MMVAKMGGRCNLASRRVSGTLCWFWECVSGMNLVFEGCFESRFALERYFESRCALRTSSGKQAQWVVGGYEAKGAFGTQFHLPPFDLSTSIQHFWCCKSSIHLSNVLIFVIPQCQNSPKLECEMNMFWSQKHFRNPFWGIDQINQTHF